MLTLKIMTVLNKYKKALLVIGGSILLFVLGYASGRFVQPAKVITKTITEVKTETKIQYQDRIVKEKVYVQTDKVHEHTDTTVEKHPDGTVITKTSKDKNTDETKSNKENSNESKSTSNDTKTDQKTTTIKIVESKQLDWKVGVGAGVSIPVLLGHQDLGVPGMKGAVIQADIGRRIIGPIFLDVFGNTQGVVGAGLSIVF